MRALTHHVDFAGITQQVDIDIPDAINNIKKSNQAVFIETILDIFTSIDLDGIELEEWQIAVLRKKMTRLNQLFRFKTIDVAIDFLDWCINNEVDYTLPDFEAETIFKTYLNSKS